MHHMKIRPHINSGDFMPRFALWDSKNLENTTCMKQNFFTVNISKNHACADMRHKLKRLHANFGGLVTWFGTWNPKNSWKHYLYKVIFFTVQVKKNQACTDMRHKLRKLHANFGGLVTWFGGMKPWKLLKTLPVWIKTFFTVHASKNQACTYMRHMLRRLYANFGGLITWFGGMRP